MSKETDKEFLARVRDLGKISLKERIKAVWTAFIGALNDIWTFIWFMVRFAIALAIGFLGIYGIVKGLHEPMWLRRWAFTVGGVSAAVDAACMFWKLVIKRV